MNLISNFKKIENDKNNPFKWVDLSNIIYECKCSNLDYCIIYDEMHVFPKNLSIDFLNKNICICQRKDIKLLIGGVWNYDTVVPISENLYWTNFFLGTSLLVIFQSIYDIIINYDSNVELLHEYLSREVLDKAIIYPSISNFNVCTDIPDFEKNKIKNMINDCNLRLETIQRKYIYYYK